MSDLEELDRPVLQGLGQQRVVGVGQRPTVRSQASSQPSPAWSSRIRISSATASAGWVSLSWMATLSGKAFQSLPRRRKRRDDVGQRAGDQEILLDEPEVAAARGGVVGIEDAGEGLGGDLVVDGAEEVAAAELEEVEVLVRGRPPEPQRVDGLAAVADDRPIVGNASEDRRQVRHHDQPPVLHLERAVERHLDGLPVADHLPGVGMAQPVVRVLDLAAVVDLLAEHAVLVAQAVADGRDLQRGQRVDEAGGQPAEAAVAQAGVGLFLGERDASRGRASAPRSSRTNCSTCRLVMLLASVRPMRNSIDR